MLRPKRPCSGYFFFLIFKPLLRVVRTYICVYLRALSHIFADVCVHCVYNPVDRGTFLLYNVLFRGFLTTGDRFLEKGQCDKQQQKRIVKSLQAERARVGTRYERKYIEPSRGEGGGGCLPVLVFHLAGFARPLFCFLFTLVSPCFSLLFSSLHEINSWC